MAGRVKAARAADDERGRVPRGQATEMREQIEGRLRELARRAGVRGAPPAVVGAALVLAAAAMAWAAWRWWPGASESAGEPVVVRASAVESSAPAASSETTPAALVVHVVGAVRHPGVYELPEGARVSAALEAAGGALPDARLSAVNLARPLADGEQIAVPDEDEVAAGVSGLGAATLGGVPAPAAAPGAPLDINAADAAALDTLPGVGPSTAQKIVADREANGPFASVADLGRVSGIGPKKLEQLKGLVVVR